MNWIASRKKISIHDVSNHFKSVSVSVCELLQSQLNDGRHKKPTENSRKTFFSNYIPYLRRRKPTIFVLSASYNTTLYTDLLMCWILVSIKSLCHWLWQWPYPCKLFSYIFIENATINGTLILYWSIFNTSTNQSIIWYQSSKQEFTIYQLRIRSFKCHKLIISYTSEQKFKLLNSRTNF